MDYLPRISIIIPCYNAEKYIKKCIQSVFNQTYKNIELILINDGSTDKTNDIIFENIKNKTNVIYVNDVNKGVSNARNQGIKKATGKYIMFIDSDDYISKNAVNNMYKLMRKNDSDIVKCAMSKDYILENRFEEIKPIYSKVRTIGKEDFNKTIYKIILSSEKMNSVCGSLFKTSIIKNNNILFSEEIHNGEDAIFFMDYIDKVKRFTYTPSTYYYYTIKNSGLTGTGLSMNDLWDSKLKFIERLRENEIKWNLTKKKYVDKKIVYIFVSSLLRLYKKDVSLDNIYKEQFLTKMIEEIDLIKILNKIDHTKLNITEDIKILLFEIKKQNPSNMLKELKIIFG